MSGSAPPPPLLFNRKRVTLHRHRAAPHHPIHDAVIGMAAERLIERCEEMHFTPRSILELGCHTGQLSRLLKIRYPNALSVHTDLSLPMLSSVEGLRVVVDEECLPFGPERFDLIISCLNLHWVNDLPGTFVQIQRCLTPTGIFLASMPGTQTLQELRTLLLQTELSLKGGAAPRISPFIDTKTAGILLQRAGFQMPVADSETITLSYPHLLALFHELRQMGQTGAFAHVMPYLGKSTLSSLMEQSLAASTSSPPEVLATLELISLMGTKR